MVLLDDKFSYFVLHECHPNYNDLCAYGCTWYVHLDHTLHNKFYDKMVPYKLVGYANEYKD